MRSWELSRNIIAFFQSFPIIDRQPVSIFSTVITQNLQMFNYFHSSYDNPEVKDDPYEIVEELVTILDMTGSAMISIDLLTNIDYISKKRHQQIFEEFVIPMLHALSNHVGISELIEKRIDLFSLQGLFDLNRRQLIPEMVNTVIYI